MTVQVIEAVSGVVATTTGSPYTASVTLTTTPQAGDKVIVVATTPANPGVTTVAGLGGTFSLVVAKKLIGSMGNYVYLGTGATAAGAVTVTMNFQTTIHIQVLLVRGLGSGVSTFATDYNLTGGGPGATKTLAPGIMVQPDTFVLGISQQSGGSTGPTWPSSTTSSGFTTNGPTQITGNSAYVGVAWQVTTTTYTPAIGITCGTGNYIDDQLIYFGAPVGEQVEANYVEALTQGTPSALVESAYTEALTQGSPAALIESSYVEVLTPRPANEFLGFNIGAFSLSTYRLDWSPADVGKDIVYPAGMMLTKDVPAGATCSIRFPNGRAHGSTTSFTLPVTMAMSGTVSFWQRTSSEGSFDKLFFYIDGVSQGSWSGETTWAQVSFPISAGAHTLQWSYSKDGSASAGQDTAFVALLTITGITSPLVPTADPRTPKILDFEDGTVPTELSTTSWTSSTDLPITGSRSLRTPAVTANSTTYTASLAVTPPENAAVTYDWKVSAEATDVMTAEVNGTVMATHTAIGGATTTAWLGHIIPGGTTSTVRWSYIKDTSFSGGSDAAWLDNVTVPFAISSGPTTGTAGFTVGLTAAVQDVAQATGQLPLTSSLSSAASAVVTPVLTGQLPLTISATSAASNTQPPTGTLPLTADLTTAAYGTATSGAALTTSLSASPMGVASALLPATAGASGAAVGVATGFLGMSLSFSLRDQGVALGSAAFTVDAPDVAAGTATSTAYTDMAGTVAVAGATDSTVGLWASASNSTITIDARLNSYLIGTGTLTGKLALLRSVALSGEGSLRSSTAFAAVLDSNLSGTGTLSCQTASVVPMDVELTAFGTLRSHAQGTTRDNIDVWFAGPVAESRLTTGPAAGVGTGQGPYLENDYYFTGPED